MFKSQFYSMIKRRGFYFSFLLVIFISFLYPIILIYQHLLNGFDIASLVDPRFAFIGSRYTNAWYYMYEYFPLILMFPFAYSYSSDKRSHYDCVMISRGGIKKYLYAKAFCCMIGGFIITFTPMLVNMIVNYVFLPYTSNDSSYNSIPEEILRFVDKGFYKTKSNDAYLWLISPKSSILFSTLRMGILGATVSLVIYVISMFINNLRFFYFSVLPVLIFFVASHKIQENREHDSFSIDIMEYATTGSYSAYNPFFFWIVCGIFILVSFIVIFIFTKKDQI